MFESSIKYGRYTAKNKEEEQELSKYKSQKKRQLEKRVEKACFNCSKEISSFHKSHSIPHSILKNLKSGNVGTYNIAADIFLAKKEEGIARAGVFYLICSDCDGPLFSAYENNSDMLGVGYTDEMIMQIMMKNYLSKIYRSKYALSTATSFINDMDDSHRISGLSVEDFSTPDLEILVYKAYQQTQIAELDIQRYTNDFKLCKKQLAKKRYNSPFVFFQKRLDYTVPIAFHHSFALPYDLSGEKVYDVYGGNNPDSSDLHICIFPRGGYSEILLIIENSKRAEKYRNFRKQFNKLTEDDKLQAILFLIFRYSDQSYSSPLIEHILEKDEAIGKLSSETNYWEYKGFLTKEQQEAHIRSTCDFHKRHKIPKLLSAEFSIEALSCI